MNKMQKNTHVFTKMNDDADLSRLENGEYKFASSFRLISKNGNLGAVENTEGCELVDFELPEGENRVIGYAKDDTNACGYYFVWNENNVHSILRYDNVTTSISLLWQSEVGNDILKFDKDFLIAHARVVDNFLLWTDGLNPVSQINITRALAGEYLTPQIEQQIRLGKQPPHYPPRFVYLQDSNKITNYIAKRVFQFAVRYIYIDDQVSTLSPYSAVAWDNVSEYLVLNNPVPPFTPIATDIITNQPNFIEIDFGADLLGNDLPIKSNPAYRQLIKGVEVLVRGGEYALENNSYNEIVVNRAAFRTVAVIENFTEQDYKFKFYNDNIYQAISDNELHLYEALPIHAGCLEVKDNRVFVANNNEDRDKEPIDVELTVNFLNYGGHLTIDNHDGYDDNVVNTTLMQFDETFEAVCNPLLGNCQCFQSFAGTLLVYQTKDYIGVGTANVNLKVDLSNVVATNGGYLQIILEGSFGLNTTFWITTSGTQTISIPFARVMPNTEIKVSYIAYVGGKDIATNACLQGQTAFDVTRVELTLDYTAITVGKDTLVNPFMSSLKRGGVYQYGLVYFDEYNRYSVVHDFGAVKFNGINQTKGICKFNLPATVENIYKYFDTIPPQIQPAFIHGQAVIEWAINHKPPIWATHYAWVRTKNLAQGRYFQWVIQQALYVKQYQDNVAAEKLDDAVLTTNAGEAVEIYLSFENIFFTQDKVSDSTLSTWLPEPNDRLRLLFRATNSFTSTLTDFRYNWVETRYYDVPIKARRGNWLVVETAAFRGLAEKLFTGDVVEVYSPQVSNTNIFYEVAEVFRVINPKTPNRLHGKGFGTPKIAQDQTATTPATGIFMSGDSFFRYRQAYQKVIPAGQEYTKAYPTWQQSTTGVDDIYALRIFIQDQSISDVFFSKAEDIGRVAIVDKNAKNRQKGNFIRFSDVYIPNTKINGLSTFQPLNEKDLPIEYGGVNALRNASSSQVEGNVMLALMTTNSLSLYIGRAVLTQQGGGQLTAIADQVINTVNELDGGYGCQNPESVVENNGYVYYFDARKGRLLRYASNGLFPISNYGFSKFFSDRGREMRRIPNINEKRVFGGFDVRNGEYIVTFTHPTFYPEPQPAITIAFSESSDGFSTFFPYAPEYFGNVGSEMLLFKEGQLWRANSKNVPYNNFFGVQYATELHFAEQQYPFTDKIFQTIVSKSSFSADSEFFYAYEFQTNLNQLSTLDKNSYNRTPFTDPRLESDFYASILRDTNTPVANALFNGDLMRGQFMLIKMRCEAEALCLLRFVEVGFVASSGQ